jgi:hypothetical protein
VSVSLPKTLAEKKCVETYQHNCYSNKNIWGKIIDTDEIWIFREIKKEESKKSAKISRISTEGKYDNINLEAQKQCSNST